MSIQNIVMPQLGESVTEGTIEKWLVQIGDKVNKYDPLAEVTTDKVSAEIPSSFSGTITELIAKEGETLPVGTIVCMIEVVDEETTNTDPQQKSSNVSTAIINVGVLKSTTPNTQEIVRPKREQIVRQKLRYSPAVLKLASDHQIDLEVIEGTGLEGRITRKDILKHIASGNLTKNDSTLELNKLHQEETLISAVEKNVVFEATGETDTEIPLTAVRRAIANNMVRSKHEIPHAWVMMEVDVTNLVTYRDSLKQDFKAKEGFNLTYFAFFLKAVAIALKEYPMMNSVWAGDKIIIKKDINLSIAVGTDDALYVPVIKYADELSIKGIAKEIHELSVLARSGKLRNEHIQGGTFTVNNTGAFGSVQSMGIINYPQAAILQVESIVKRPVIVQGNMFAARDMVNLCLSIDHRVLDGIICGNFLNKVKNILENVNKQSMPIY